MVRLPVYHRFVYLFDLICRIVPLEGIDLVIAAAGRQPGYSRIVKQSASTSQKSTLRA